MTDLTYIVTAPSFSPDNGGAIFQHSLVDTLNRMGEQALLWKQPPHRRHSLKRRLKRLIAPQPFRLNPDLDTPLATRADLGSDAVVVYPEIILGNPLKARNVVRWLLYPPGKRYPYRFGENEMFFTVGELCDLPEVTGGAPDLFLWKINPAYRNENREGRAGVCYMDRKGADKPRIPETEGAIRLDGKSHEEIAGIFNRSEAFYSYDEATMYSQYAAVCGCLSVVVPGMYPSREAWVSDHELARYGVAYGTDPGEIAHARATGDKVLGLLQAEEAKGLETVKNFVGLTRERFAA